MANKSYRYHKHHIITKEHNSTNIISHNFLHSLKQGAVLAQDCMVADKVIGHVSNWYGLEKVPTVPSERRLVMMEYQRDRW